MGGRSLRIRGTTYPVILPKLSDPRLRLSTTFVFLYLLGEFAFSFRLSLPQIFTPLLTCAVLEFAITFWKKKAIVWPASALLTGDGIAFILRIPGAKHGEWWSTRGLWIYAAVAVVSLLSKYLIQFRGKHVFNPSNLGLVLGFLILGSHRTEPLQFWWGPTSIWLILVLGTIVTGALIILSRINLLEVAAGFWATFVCTIGVIALSGHAMTARWHLGPVTDGYFWRILIFSPEVFIFMSFMITDPRTVPETRAGRRLFAVSIGVLSAFLIAPQITEFAIKVSLLGSLTIICAARPVVILLREWLARSSRESLFARFGRSPGELLHRLPGGSAGRGAIAALVAASFAGLLVLAGSPARSVAGIVATPAATAQLPPVTVAPSPGVVKINRATARQIAAAIVADVVRVTPDYRIGHIGLDVQPAKGQAPPVIIASLTDPATNAVRTMDVALDGAGFKITHDTGAKMVVVAKPKHTAPVKPLLALPKGTAGFSQTVLKDVAPQVGLNFTQDAFHYSMSDEPPAMMGGGVCWLDYNNDGWMDLFAVNSYSDANLPDWEQGPGLPRSALFENDHGKFVNVTKSSGAGLQVQGTGCVAGDFNGDGYTDLLVTTSTGVDLLWNNGNGTFTEGALAAGINPKYAWYSGAAVADVNGDGRPDIFIAGYTNMLDPIATSINGFPTNHQGVRDLLYLNEGNGKDGRAHFKEAGRGGRPRPGAVRPQPRRGVHRRHGDGRPTLAAANDEDPNKLYVNVPIAGGAKADPAGLGFRFVNEAGPRTVSRTRRPVWVWPPGTTRATAAMTWFITNSRHQARHAAYEATVPSDGRGVLTLNTQSVFNKALGGRSTVGWGRLMVDLQEQRLPGSDHRQRRDPRIGPEAGHRAGAGAREPRCTGKDRTVRQNASGITDRVDDAEDHRARAAAADWGQQRLGLRRDQHDRRQARSAAGTPGSIGNWLDVATGRFHPDSVVTAVLPERQEARPGGARGKQLPLVRVTRWPHSASARRRRRSASSPSAGPTAP